jgi:hypothetical protein
LEAITMLRFSLLTSLLVIVIAALGAAAIAHPNRFWCVVIFNLTLAVLLAAALTAVVKRWPFSVGFAVVGWIYSAIAFIDVGGIRKFMVTDLALDWLRQAITPPPDSLPAFGLFLYLPVIGHSLWTLILACIGGIAAGWLASQSTAGHLGRSKGSERKQVTEQSG